MGVAAAVVVNVIEGERVLGEVEVYNDDDQNGVVWEREIRISHYSQPSERCPPLAVLHTITSSSASPLSGFCFKMELKDKCQPSQNSPLSLLHSTCLRENKVLLTHKTREKKPEKRLQFGECIIHSQPSSALSSALYLCLSL